MGKIMGLKTIKLIPECAKERLSYNHETGIFTWTYKNKAHPNLFMKEAGAIREGYVVIKINGSAFRAHRIAWFLFYGIQPNIIDHINGDKQDNRICNLRDVTNNENAKNHKIFINGSGLPCGIRMLPSGKYQARITCNKKVIYLGSFNKLNDASIAYENKRISLFGEYARI